MNVAEILKDCPKGTKLYSTIYGEVEFMYVVDDHRTYKIFCRKIEGDMVFPHSFTKDGKMVFTDAEPTLFPSKYQRDWSKFGVSDQVTDQETKPQFKPFDKVLVRDNDDKKWDCDIFCHLGNKERIFICIRNWWRQCIPYEGNEHLLGTKNKPE